MSLNFPYKPDIQLENSPLIEVVCQVRHPSILRIADEEPSEFQEHIKSQFPQVELESGFVVRVPKSGIEGSPSPERQSRYRFCTLDGQTTISLAADFYALSIKNYTNWEDFAQYLSLTHKAVQSVYAPTYATRIGLRYINRLTPVNAGFNTVDDLLELLHPQLTTQWRSEAWSNPVEMRCRLVFTDDSAKLTLGTYYGEEKGQPFFLLDFDYYEEGQLNLDDLIERCHRYNEVIYRAFRWCVRDEKLSVFNPKAEEASN